MKENNRSAEIALLGTRIYYEYAKLEDKKSPCTFVLIHGFLANTFSFRKLFPLLKEKYDTYAIDLPGFGKSKKSDRFHYSYQNYSQLLIEFIHQLELKNVILVGHSMGGQISLYTAKQAPELINRLILIGCSGYLQRAGKHQVWLSYLPLSRNFVKWWIKRHKVEDILRTTVYNASCIDKEMIEAYEKPVLESGFCDTLLGLLRYREGDLSTEDLRKVQQPALLIWGEEDKIVPVRTGLKLAEDIVHSTFVALPEAGHQVMEEKPTQVFAEIEKWLADFV
jgi:pimeloyl-ACP methyl ester carboxylesterase